MRSLLAIAVLVIASGNTFATGSLSFEGAGYVLDFEVGQQDSPALTGVSFMGPGVSPNSMVRPLQLVVTEFDAKAKVLVVRWRNPGDDKLPPDFELSVHGSKGILKLPKRSFSGKFNWEM